MTNKHRATVLLLAIGMFLTVARPAEAYIDAGSGSYVLQILFAALFGAAFTVKSTFANLKTAFLARRSRSARPEQDA